MVAISIMFLLMFVVPSMISIRYIISGSMRLFAAMALVYCIDTTILAGMAMAMIYAMTAFVPSMFMATFVSTVIILMSIASMCMSIIFV